MFIPQIDSDRTPPWVIQAREKRNYRSKGLSRNEATEYIKERVDFDWRSDLLDTLAEEGRGPHFWEDDVSGDVYYRVDDLDGWLRYYLNHAMKAGEPLFDPSMNDTVDPIRWLCVTDSGNFAYDLRGNLSFWGCDVYAVSTVSGALACAHQDFDAAVIDLSSNLDAVLVLSELLKARGIPTLIIVRGVENIPLSVLSAGHILRYPNIDHVRKAINAHMPHEVVGRMQMTNLCEDDLD